LPGFFLEPAPIRHIRVQGRLLPLEPETDLLLEDRSGLAGNLNVPAAVLLRSPPREDAEVEQQELDHLAQFHAGSAKGRALFHRIAVRIEVGTQEGSHHALRRAENCGRDFLHPSANTRFQTQVLEELLHVFRAEGNAPPPFIPLLAGLQSEKLLNESDKT